MSDSEYESDSDNSVNSAPKPAAKYAKTVPGAKKVPPTKTAAAADSDDEEDSVATDDDEVSVHLDASDDEDEEIDENELYNTGTAKQNADNAPAPFRFGDNSDDEREDTEDEDDMDDLEDEHYLQKLDESVRDQTIRNHHPELMSHNFEEINALTLVSRDENGVIVDELHKTNPFLTKYERARILGERARQINEGAKPFVEVKEGIIDGFLIAEEELKQRRIPFIIRRPLSNGRCEYWKLTDLEIL